MVNKNIVTLIIIGIVVLTLTNLQGKKEADPFYAEFLLRTMQYSNGELGIGSYFDAGNTWIDRGETGRCYQEDATEATACGGLSTGSYSQFSNHQHATHKYSCDNAQFATSMSRSHDGDYETWCGARTDGDTAQFFVNYTKPPLATSAFWQVRSGNRGSMEVEIPDNCFNYYDNTLSLSITTDDSGGGHNDFWCHNSTGRTIISAFGPNSGNGVREEAMFWVLT